MALTLSAPIAAYFAADARNDPAALAQCFAEHGVVRDEGRTIQGPAAIAQWMAAAKAKYQHRIAPIAAAEWDGSTVVRGKVSGSFPNSPVELDHVFRLEGDRIASLEIG